MVETDLTTTNNSFLSLSRRPSEIKDKILEINFTEKILKVFQFCVKIDQRGTNFFCLVFFFGNFTISITITTKNSDYALKKVKNSSSYSNNLIGIFLRFLIST